jgi:hypothetical protein
MEDLQMHFELSVLGAYDKSLGTHRDRVAIATEISVGGQKSVWQVHFLRSLKRVGSIRRDGEASNKNDERAGCQHSGGGVVVSSPWQVSGRCAASGSNASGVFAGMDGGRDESDNQWRGRRRRR